MKRLKRKSNGPRLDTGFGTPGHGGFSVDGTKSRPTDPVTSPIAFGGQISRNPAGHLDGYTGMERIFNCVVCTERCWLVCRRCALRRMCALHMPPLCGFILMLY